MKSISVPIEMFIKAQVSNELHLLRFFLLLKLKFTCGKFKNESAVFDELQEIDNIKSSKTTDSYVKKLVGKGWLNINSKTNFYLIKSFDEIRLIEGYNSRLAFPVTISNYKQTKPITGAIIYGYLHKEFWKKVRKDKSVQIKGSTYNFISPKFNYKNQLAPVSVIGVRKYFNISIATASRLKNDASKFGYIKLVKNYSQLEFHSKAMLHYIKYNDLKENIVFKNGSYKLQLIDTVCPLFYFHKRKNLKTYNKGIVKGI